MTKLLQLTNGTFATVDAEDFDRLSTRNWTDNKTVIERCEGKTNHLYSKNWQSIHISLASEIMNTRGIMYDHIDQNYRNNVKSNLRVTNPALNKHNSYKNVCFTSKYKGVCWHKRRSKWQAYIRFNRQLKFLGYFKEEIEAAKAYDKAAIELYKDYASPNFK